MKKLTIIVLLISLFCNFLVLGQDQKATKERLKTDQAENLIDIRFSKTERDSMQEGLNENLEHYKAMHDYSMSNDIPPALIFNPLPAGFAINPTQNPVDFNLPDNIDKPQKDSDLAFMTVAELSVLIRSKKISSIELTKLYISRLKKYADTLECMVTLLEDQALKKAEQADNEIAEGNYKGPLHGIPYGLKDLFAVEDTKTTWGAMAYKEQVIDQTATIVKKLDEAGAILVAKLTLGALAMGDVWYGGKTRNPWNLAQGSSGSSAGPGAATAAGLVAFAIGTETLGSIVSPSTRNGVSGLRPTFGRVSRAGGMALSWSMDKAGPMCRSAKDCAIVLDAIYGPDGIDQAVIEAPFNFKEDIDVSRLKVGYLKDLFEREYGNRSNDSISLLEFEKLGINLVPVSLPGDIPYSAMRIILAAEAGAAFDELTRSGNDDLLVRQDKGAWPNFFRESRFIPAVEYIQANRVRYVLIQEMQKLFSEYDAIISPSFGGPQLLATNLTGHPVVVVPNGFNKNNSPTSISIIGRLFDEGTILSIASQYQTVTDFDDKHPPLFMQ